jgi:hypothetical protein
MSDTSFLPDALDVNRGGGLSAAQLDHLEGLRRAPASTGSRKFVQAAGARRPR